MCVIILFYFSFLKAHLRCRKIVGRYWFVHSAPLTNLPCCFLARIRVAKCKANPQSIQEGGAQLQVERRLPGSRSLTLSACLRLRSRDPALGMPAMESLFRLAQAAPVIPSRAAVQANRPSSNLSPWGTALKTPANEY